MRFLALAWCLLLPGVDGRGPAAGAAEAPKPATIDPKELDRALYDALRDIHNRGADLYNAGDSVGCYRLFLGALQVSRAALAHRPAQQKLIDDGIVAADQQGAMSQRAFILHELIEKVRSSIRPEGLKPEPRKGDTIPPEKKEAQKMPEGPRYEPLPVVPREAGPDVKTPGPKKEPAIKSNDPTLGARNAIPPLPKLTRGVGGRVLFRGNPLPGADVTFVTRERIEPRVYESATARDGTYRMEEVEPGRYTVLLTGGRDLPANRFPERYSVANTSPLVVDVKPAGDTLDFLLQ